MNVLVTGASGFVGEGVLGKLYSTGHSIRILARNPASHRVKNFAGRFGAEIHCGDILDGASLFSGFDNVDAVIHLVGIISEVGASTFENIHIVGTRNVVNAAQKSGVKRFIHMSALGTRPNAVARYHRSKWEAEEIVRNSGLDHVIFRPSIIYGAGDSFVNLFAKMARCSPVLPVMGNGHNKFQPIPVSDVAACFVKALDNPATVGRTFDLCGPEALSFDEVLDTILQVMGKRRLKIHVPMALARIQAAMLEFFCGLFGKVPPLNRDQLLMLQEDNVGNPAPANNLFELKPISLADGIRTYIRAL